MKNQNEAFRLYRPSSGTEGMGFMDHFCANCIHEHPHPDKEPKCEVLSHSFFYDIDEPEYPKEWCYVNNRPTCTKFLKWDWGHGPDDWNEPDDPEPIDPIAPNQLIMPFDIWELLGVDQDVIVTKTAILEREYS